MRELNLNGKLIVFEGLGGSGKTSQTLRLQRWVDDNWPKDNIHYSTSTLTSEPYESFAKDIINRNLAKGKKLSSVELAMLLTADRHSHIRELISWEVEDNYSLHILDRYYYSTLVYQSVLENPPIDIWNPQPEDIEYEEDLSFLYGLQNGLPKPDLVFWLYAEPQTCYDRISSRLSYREKRHTFEELDFLEKLHDQYEYVMPKMQSAGHNIEKICTDSETNEEKVFSCIVSVLKDYMKMWGLECKVT